MPVFLEGYGESEGIYKIAAGLRGYLGGGRKKEPSSGSEEEGQEVKLQSFLGNGWRSIAALCLFFF